MMTIQIKYYRLKNGRLRGEVIGPIYAGLPAYAGSVDELKKRIANEIVESLEYERAPNAQDELDTIEVHLE